LRYFFYLSYKGTNYHGWQVQPNANTVQAEINSALSTIMQAKIETVGSGRTDAGVHAKMQVFHTVFPEMKEVEAIPHKLNSLLPADIVINKMLAVKNDAHARFHAISRSYEYHIGFKKSPFMANESLFLPKKPDFALIKQACKTLLGEQDFTSFSKVKTEVNNFYCEITKAEWQFDEEKVVFYVTANRFLRGMVRALVGTLLDVGFGKVSLDDFARILQAKDRTAAGQSVSPQGLYLCDVRYPSEVFVNNNH
jgi:tRNA pseudouridine38-40 synthase